MGKIIEPGIKVDNIEVNIDKYSTYIVDQIKSEWGYSVPIVKINGYTLNIGDIESLNINVNMFDIPSFNIVIKDYNYKIQEQLSNKTDTCVIFIGNNKFYVKFNGLITRISASFTKTLQLSGIFYCKELFEFKQEGFIDTSITDILTKICTDTKLGLFTYDNAELEIKPEYHLNPNNNQITFISDTIGMYTTNLWCIDTFGYLHVGSLTSILSKPVDKYSINPKTCEPLEDGPQDILFTFQRSKNENETDNEKYKYEIQVDDLTIETDFSLTKLQTTQSSILYDGAGNGKYLDINTNIGIENSINTENTFSGFINDKFPLRNERINKLLYGNVISLKLKNYLVEIVPFTLVNLEIYYNATANLDTRNIVENSEGFKTEDFTEDGDLTKASYRLDTIHSGKHFVAGYSYHYRKSGREPNAITQKIILI